MRKELYLTRERERARGEAARKECAAQHDCGARITTDVIHYTLKLYRGRTNRLVTAIVHANAFRTPYILVALRAKRFVASAAAFRRDQHD